MLIARTPYILKKIYYSLIWDLQNGEKDIFLTFDDGPNPEITPKVLEILEQFNARATFFCIGRNVERYPDVYRQITHSGHSVGNHTYSHLKGWATTNTEYYNDIELAGKFIRSNLFRPPYGKIKRSQLKHLRQFYNIIMWDIMSSDYDRDTGKEKCLKNVLDNARPGSIIVFHDSVKASDNMLYALPRVLESFSQNGFVMKNLESYIPLASFHPSFSLP
ncbi:MAG: polysaccharide deacetylase family protein [Bacteroidales bacterium]|nr:polysaccharide deacetylase family protein [Bacteroidales bacterium]